MRSSSAFARADDDHRHLAPLRRSRCSTDSPPLRAASGRAARPGIRRPAVRVSRPTRLSPNPPRTLRRGSASRTASPIIASSSTSRCRMRLTVHQIFPLILSITLSTSATICLHFAASGRARAQGSGRRSLVHRMPIRKRARRFQEGLGLSHATSRSLIASWHRRCRLVDQGQRYPLRPCGKAERSPSLTPGAECATLITCQAVRRIPKRSRRRSKALKERVRKAFRFLMVIS